MANPVVENLQLVNLLTNTLGGLFGSPGSTQTTTNTGGTTSETRSGGSQTQSGGDYTITDKLNISKEGIDQMLRELMEDDSTGFARVASGQKLAGLYNTSSRQMLLNDLLTRSAGQVAKATAEKVQTKTATPVTTSRSPETVTRTTAPSTTVTEKPGGGGIFGGAAGGALSTILTGALLYKGLGGAAAVKDIYSSIFGGNTMDSLLAAPTGIDYAANAAAPFYDNLLSSSSDVAALSPDLSSLITPDAGYGINPWSGFDEAADTFNIGAMRPDQSLAGTAGVDALDAFGGVDLSLPGAEFTWDMGYGMGEFGGEAAATELGLSSLSSTILPMMAVLNAGKIGDIAGSIGSGVNDFVGGLFGMGDDDPWSDADYMSFGTGYASQRGLTAPTDVADATRMYSDWIDEEARRRGGAG